MCGGSHTETNTSLTPQRGRHTYSHSHRTRREAHTQTPRHNGDRHLAHTGRDTSTTPRHCPMSWTSSKCPSSGHIQAQTPSGLLCHLPDEEGSVGPFALKPSLSVQGSSGLRFSSPYMSCSSPRSQGEGQGLESPQRATPSLRVLRYLKAPLGS